MTAAQSETRAVNRVLAHTRDQFLSGIANNAYNHSPAAAMIFGRLIEDMFRDRPLPGAGKEVLTGGESVVKRVRLGKNTTTQRLATDMDTLDTSRQHHIRFARGNWKYASAAVTLSKHDLGTNRGSEALSNMMRDKLDDAVNSLVDLLTGDTFENNGVSTATNDFDTIVSANDAVHGLNGSTYGDWNSRGVSARGTAAGSVSFAGGSFTQQGLADMRTAYNNATEGVNKPQAIIHTWDIHGFYEGKLQPQERFQNTMAADAGFTNLMFKSAPTFADDKAKSGNQLFLNFDWLKMVVLAGFDFDMSDFIRVHNQPALVAQLLWTGELMCWGRKFQNKIQSITA